MLFQVFIILFGVLFGICSSLSSQGPLPKGYLWYFGNCDTTQTANFYYSIAANTCFVSGSDSTASSSQIVVQSNADGTTTYNFYEYEANTICTPPSSPVTPINAVADIPPLSSCVSGFEGTYYQSGSYSLPSQLQSQSYVKLEFFAESTCSVNEYPATGALIFPINPNQQFDCIPLDYNSNKILKSLFGLAPSKTDTYPAMKFGFQNSPEVAVDALQKSSQLTLNTYTDSACTTTIGAKDIFSNVIFKSTILSEASGCTSAFTDPGNSPISGDHQSNGFKYIKAKVIIAQPQSSNQDDTPTILTAPPNVNIPVGVGVGIGAPILIIVTALSTYFFMQRCSRKKVKADVDLSTQVSNA